MTREKLRAYRNIKTERDQLKELIMDLESTIYSPAIPRLDAVPGGGTNNSSPVENAASKHEAMLAKYAEKLNALDGELIEIENAISSLPHRERTLLRLHCIQGLTLEESAERMYYSTRTIDRIFESAVAILKSAE